MPLGFPGNLGERAWAAARLRCPHCLKGPVFHGVAQMYPQCPVCRYVFEREPGYFLGAIAIGYFVAVFVVATVGFTLHWMRPSLSWELVFFVGVVAYLVLTPVVFRYARTVWMYADSLLDPPAE